MKNAIINICLSVGSVIITFLIIEGAAQTYIYKIAMKGKLFNSDSMVGWRVKPQIQIKRKNADGDTWIIRTDKNGFRGNSCWDTNQKRIVILGDSFAFGQGVNIEDRFDATINRMGYCALNTGVMGYGTDQQFLNAKLYLSQLNKGDLAVILTYYNDFYDITRKQHSGRFKPWYELGKDGLQLHKPHITWKEILRDKSYVYAKLRSLIAKNQTHTFSNIIHAAQIYQMIIENEVKQLASKGVPSVPI